MSAYDTRKRRQSDRLLSLEPSPPNADLCIAAAGPTTWSDHTRADTGAVINALIDRIADRVAEAVITRLGSERDDRDEWFDSRQAAEYLGLHRDTLRRLAAARAIPAEQDGRGCRLFFRRSVLDDWRLSGGCSRHLAAIADAA
jgi:excisionase family DNA binding protein